MRHAKRLQYKEYVYEFVRACVCASLFCFVFYCVTSGTHPSTPFSAVKIAIEKLIVLTLFCLCLFSC